MRYPWVLTNTSTTDYESVESEFFISVQLTILVWAEPKIKRPGAKRSPIVPHLRISRSTQVAGEN